MIVKYNHKLIMGTAFLSVGAAIKNYALIGVGGAWIGLGIISKFKEKKENRNNAHKYYIVSKRKIAKK